MYAYWDLYSRMQNKSTSSEDREFFKEKGLKTLMSQFLQGRDEIYSEVFSTIAANPIKGVGVYQIGSVLAEKQSIVRVIHAHNWFLEVLTSGGLIGGVLYLYLLFGAMWRGWSTRSWLLSIVVTFIGVQITESFSTHIFWFSLGQWFFIMALGAAPVTEQASDLV